MSVSMAKLSLVLLYSIILGGFFGAVYDTVRLLRIIVGVKYSADSLDFDLSSLKLIGKFFKKKKNTKKTGRAISIYVALGDVVFWIFCAVCMSIFTYYYNDGEFRFFILFGAVIGFLIYYFTLGRLVIYLSGKIILILKIFFLYTSFFIFYPIFLVFSKIFSVFSYFIDKIILIIQKMYVIIYMVYYTRRQEKGIQKEVGSLFFACMRYNDE